MALGSFLIFGLVMYLNRQNGLLAARSLHIAAAISLMSACGDTFTGRPDATQTSSASSSISSVTTAIDFSIRDTALFVGDSSRTVIEDSLLLAHSRRRFFSPSVQWRSTDTTVLTVTAQGVLYARAEGSADAASLVKYAEIEAGEMRHAVRFAANKTQQAYVFPATNFGIGKPDPSLPPMGTRLRLKESVDLSGFPTSVQVILTGIKKYGMILADNGPQAPSLYFDGVPDARWDEAANNKIKQIPLTDLEVVETGPITKGY